MTTPKSFSPTDCSNLTVLSMESSNVDCKTVGFFLKISKEIGKAWRKSLTRAKRVSSYSPQSRSLFSASFPVFSLVRDLLFDCSRVLEYAKIRTVLQSSSNVVFSL